jgi:hypothetical protein
MARPNLEQGEGGATRTKSTGSHLDQGEGGAGKQDPAITQKGGKIPADVPAPKLGGSHTDPHPGTTSKTAVRGGGGVGGHMQPGVGKGSSGSHLEPQPGLQKRSNQPSKKYLS